MKRSEMVSKMKWWIDDQLYNKVIILADGSSIQTDEIDEESVSDMLEYMEELGMEPPYNGPDKMDLGDGLFVLMNYRWDKE